MKSFYKRNRKKNTIPIRDSNCPIVEYTFNGKVVAKVSLYQINLLRNNLSEYEALSETEIIKNLLERDLLQDTIRDEKSIRLMKLNATSQCFRTIDDWLEFRIREVFKEKMRLCKDCFLLRDDYYCHLYATQMNPNNLACESFTWKQEKNSHSNIRRDIIRKLQELESTTVYY